MSTAATLQKTQTPEHALPRRFLCIPVRRPQRTSRPITSRLHKKPLSITARPPSPQHSQSLPALHRADTRAEFTPPVLPLPFPHHLFDLGIPAAILLFPVLLKDLLGTMPLFPGLSGFPIGRQDFVNAGHIKPQFGFEAGGLHAKPGRFGMRQDLLQRFQCIPVSFRIALFFSPWRMRKRIWVHWSMSRYTSFPSLQVLFFQVSEE